MGHGESGSGIMKEVGAPTELEHTLVKRLVPGRRMKTQEVWPLGTAWRDNPPCSTEPEGIAGHPSRLIQNKPHR